MRITETLGRPTWALITNYLQAKRGCTAEKTINAEETAFKCSYWLTISDKAFLLATNSEWR